LESVGSDRVPVFLDLYGCSEDLLLIALFMPSKGVTSAAHRGPAQTFENFRAVEQMGRTSPELSKSRYYSWIPCRYIGNFNLAGVCSLRAENCQKCTGERQQDSRELVVKSLDEV